MPIHYTTDLTINDISEKLRNSNLTNDEKAEIILEFNEDIENLKIKIETIKTMISKLPEKVQIDLLLDFMEEKDLLIK